MATELVRLASHAAAAPADTRPPTSDERIEWLVDNAKAYAAVVRAIRGARESVWISQLAFDLDCVAYGIDGEQVLIADVLLEAAREHDLQVRLLMNETLLVDTLPAWRERIRAEGLSSIAVRGISRFPQLLHAKMLIVDGEEALLLGSPLVNGYWDDSEHRPVDARRPARELGGRPLHDLSVRVTGAPVADLALVFQEWWREASRHHERDGELPAAASSRDATSERAHVTVVTSEPAGSVPSRPRGATAILHEVERGIRSATDLLYVEHQYLSSRRVVSAIVHALDAAPELCVVVVLNQNPDVTAYRGWQNKRLEDAGLLHHPRVGLFTPWTAAPEAGGRWSLSQVFVHSKVVIADDRWALVGSANLDGVSLHSYGDDFSSRLGQRIFRDVRNFDVGLVIREAPQQEHAVRRLRLQLRREHLGRAVAPATGVHELDHWRAIAMQNLGVLGTLDASTACGGIMVLPYDVAPSPAGQLASLGLTEDTVNLRFKPSWLEVHCSPNWIRNMFA